MPVTENKTTCCRIESLALIYGIFNILISALGTTAGFGIILYLVIERTNEPLVNFYVTIVCVWTVPCVLVLVSSIILVCGICKKAPALVLLHFVFGVTFAVVTLGMSLLVMSDTMYTDVKDGGVIAFFVLLIYSLPLVVVYLTYVKFSSRSIVYEECNKL